LAAWPMWSAILVAPAPPLHARRLSARRPKKLLAFSFRTRCLCFASQVSIHV
jgi:hypothetical protein